MFTTPTFEETYAILFDEPQPEPYTIEETLSLTDVIAEAQITPDTHVLLATIGGQAVTIPTLSLIYHKVAQGTLNDQPFFMAFCVLCNAGSAFSSLVDDDEVHTFACRGYYQGMTLLGDDQTMSRWNHITGDCVYGEKQGKMLERLSNIQHVTAAKALEMYPDALIVTPMFTPEQSQLAREFNDTYRVQQSPEWGHGLVNTLAFKDDRLPRFDMGVGVWTNNTARYYSVLKLNDNDDVILDTLDGRNLVVYLNRDTSLPSMFYTDATQVRRIGNDLSLNNGETYRDGVLHSIGDITLPERPNFQVVRWYGFAYLFPQCEIYEA